MLTITLWWFRLTSRWCRLRCGFQHKYWSSSRAHSRRKGRVKSCRLRFVSCFTFNNYKSHSTSNLERVDGWRWINMISSWSVLVDESTQFSKLANHTYTKSRDSNNRSKIWSKEISLIKFTQPICTSQRALDNTRWTILVPNSGCRARGRAFTPTSRSLCTRTSQPCNAHTL
jgi:hypothetical protein